jgi:hypothetical protein
VDGYTLKDFQLRYFNVANVDCDGDDDDLKIGLKSQK